MAGTGPGTVSVPLPGIVSAVYNSYDFVLPRGPDITPRSRGAAMQAQRLTAICIDLMEKTD